MTIDEILHKVGQEAVDEIKRQWPIDTGESRDGWGYTVSDGRLSITNSVPYARYVHRGQALDDTNSILSRSRSKIQQMVMDHIQRGLKNGR